MIDVSDGQDRGLLGLVERIMRKPAPPEAPKPAADVDVGMADGLDPVLKEEVAPASLEPAIAIESTRELTRAQLADVILRALHGIDGCPPKGFEVTIYGHRPWNAMLRVTPAAGALRDAASWRRRVQDMVQSLRDQYELTD